MFTSDVKPKQTYYVGIKSKDNNIIIPYMNKRYLQECIYLNIELFCFNQKGGKSTFVFFRGIGLFVGIELVTDRNTKSPATVEASHVISR